MFTIDSNYRPTGKHVSRMAKVIRNCQKSEFPQYRMSAMLVKSGRVMSVGLNKPSIAEIKDARYDLGRAIHAELDAILKAARQGISTDGCSIWVAGVTKSDNLVHSAPCSICEQVIREAGIKDIFYHGKDGSIVRVKVA